MTSWKAQYAILDIDVDDAPEISVQKEIWSAFTAKNKRDLYLAKDRFGHTLPIRIDIIKISAENF